jgi:hypothetical protein
MSSNSALTSEICLTLKHCITRVVELYFLQRVTHLSDSSLNVYVQPATGTVTNHVVLSELICSQEMSFDIIETPEN